GDEEMLVRALGDAWTAAGKTFFYRRLEGGETLREGLVQDGRARLRQQPLFLLPLLIIQQVVFEAPEAQTLAAEEIPRFETVAEEPIDQKLIAVWAQALVALGIGRIQVPFERLRDTADRELLRRVLAARLA